MGGLQDFSVSPRPLGFGFLGLGLRGLGPGLDNISINIYNLHTTINFKEDFCSFLTIYRYVFVVCF